MGCDVTVTDRDVGTVFAVAPTHPSLKLASESVMATRPAGPRARERERISATAFATYFERPIARRSKPPSELALEVRDLA